jgi:hypothetical protein
MIGYAIGLARGMFELYEKPLPKYLGTMVSLLFMVIGLVIFVGAIFAGIIYASPLPVDISGANCHNIGGINEGAIYVCRYEGNLTMIAAQNETDARIATVMGKGTLVPKTYG